MSKRLFVSVVFAATITGCSHSDREIAKLESMCADNGGVFFKKKSGWDKSTELICNDGKRAIINAKDLNAYWKNNVVEFMGDK